MTFKDISYLLGTYVVISDGEINEKEMAVLHNFHTPSIEIKEKQIQIFSDDQNAISLTDLLSKAHTFSITEKEILFNLLVQIGYGDNHYDIKEKELIENISESLSYPIEKLKYIQEKVESEAKLEIHNLNWLDNIRIAFENIIYEIKEEKNEDEEYELLTGKGFIKKLESISNRANEDLIFAKKHMVAYNEVLSKYFKELESAIEIIISKKRKDKDVESLISIVEELDRTIKSEIEESLKENLRVLDKKKRTINYFTIAFMGRTKAGKSTLHKVITHENDDNIGVGKLRTTRYNRSWYWENIRIIDTPGIGAPGGMTDEETAKNIVDEADIVCYVVTNDSIQTTEFNFLKDLKDRNKPLFIILNVKDNLEHPIKYKRFQENPLEWKETQGNKSLQGHYDRIRECLVGNYETDSIQIIPLQLLAARLLYEKEISEEEKEKLRKGSNIKEFVTRIKHSIRKTGNLKKTQNIIDGCCYQINAIKILFESKSIELKKLLELITSKKVNLSLFIEKEKDLALEQINKIIKSRQQALLNNARNFAEDYYDKKEKEITELWNKSEDNKRCYENLSLELDQLLSEFHKTVEERIEESLSDLTMELKFLDLENIHTSKTTDWKFRARISSAVLSAIATIAISIFFSPGILVSALIGIVSFAFTYGLSSLFKSKSERIKEAKEKIYNKIEKNINRDFLKIEKNISSKFNDSIDTISKTLNENFNVLLDGISFSVKIIDDVIKESQKKESLFGAVFYNRILQYFNKNSFDINDEELVNIIKVNRNYRDSEIVVEAPYNLDIEETKQIELLLQSKIKFSHENK